MHPLAFDFERSVADGRLGEGREICSCTTGWDWAKRRMGDHEQEVGIGLGQRDLQGQVVDSFNAAHLAGTARGQGIEAFDHCQVVADG